MDLYAFRILRSQPLRLVLTVGGIGLCIVLMLFLLSVYNGVADGSVEYIRRNNADLWVLQRNAWNILRGSSLMSSLQTDTIRQLPDVQSASEVLLLLSAIRKGAQTATVFLTGFEPAAGLGGPPHIVEGRSVLNDDEIVLDKSFAAKYQFKVGDLVKLQDHLVRVVGISRGTNAFVIQYAFVTLRRAQALIQFPGMVTCVLVKTEGDRARVADAIRRALPEVDVYDHETFLENNIREMRSGILPFLYVVALIGTIVLTAILSLLLSINILERRRDFAILKTLGAAQGFLPRLIIQQALLICGMASMAALILFFPLSVFIETIAPEVSTKSSSMQIALVLLLVAVMSCLSSCISIRRLRQIYPLEAFS
jgi:putative ABC transport system permease protein